MPRIRPTWGRRFLSRKYAGLSTLTLLALTVLQSARAALPPGWSDADIGSPGVVGNASFASGLWTVSGGGGDIWNAADQFNFASEPFPSDGGIIAQVDSLQNTDPWAKAGIMLRNDSTAASANICLVISEANGINFQWRDTSGDQSDSVNIPGVSAPIWLALTRSVDNFNAYYSLDGTNWNQAGSTEAFPFNGSLLAGLCVAANNNSVLNTATFSNVSVSAPTFGVYRELWTNLNPNITDLSVLTNTANNPNWPNNPAAAFTHVFTNFETEVNSGMIDYGQRVRAFVVPPEDGVYTFWIASDDNSQLFLSTNESAANRVPISSVTAWTPSENWYVYPSQQSAPIQLQAGSRYYIEADMQQTGGGDDLAVGWELPDGSFERPLLTPSAAGTLLIPYTGVDSRPGIYSQSSSLTVVEGGVADLGVLATNWSSLKFQWFVNGAIAPSTAASIRLPALTVAASGQVYTCVLSNSLGAVTSAPITLTVVPDPVPPVVSRIFNVGLSQVDVVFSKPVTSASASISANYVFSDGLAVTSATLSTDTVSVVLNTGPLVYASNYSVTINGIIDRASTPVMIASNTVASFTASPFVPADIGNSPLPSSAIPTTNGLIVTAGGSAIGGGSDQCDFQYKQVTGNFDVDVRLSSLGLSSIWAEAGLMARQTLDPASAFAASLATPGIIGASFASRASAGSTGSSTGSFPVNYPNTWLRLNRAGNVFTGFASYDGQNWTQLGTITASMPSTIYLGLTVASYSTNQATTATFVDYSNTPPTAVIAAQANPHEPLGPSSRKSQIAFSEINYKPAPRADSNNLEFIEIYNSQPWFHDISKYQITCADMHYTFPQGTMIPGGGFLVVAASPASMQNVYGLTNVMGPYSGSLKKAEILQLLDEVSNVLLTVPYTSASPWPLASDGQGHSMVLANPSYGEGDPRAWDISDVVGGSPGTMESYRPSPLRNVVINEVLAHSESAPGSQFVELYNHATQSVDVSGCILTDGTTNNFAIPSGSMIPAGGFLSFAQSQLGFALNPAGETLYFVKGDHSRVLDAVQFPGQSDGVSWGRWPDGANDFYYLQSQTPGTNNSAIVIGPVAINELMYDPISESDDDQYIELYNQSSNSITLAGWQLTGGVTFSFPSNAVLPANGYAVVGRNAANLLSKYTNLTSLNTFGNYSGKLSHNGERVALTMPQPLYGSNSVTVVEDEVTYGVGGRWGQWSGGGGSSLELIDPHSNHRLAANWHDSDETQKSTWVDIENTGVLDNGANYESGILHAQIGLLDIGECLVDNVEVDFNAVNYIANPSFESGLGNWTLLGDHSRSSLEASGYQSGASLHMRATDRMWNGDNSCEANLTANSLAQGNTVTLRFKARWLRGWPEALLRLNGGWLEATGQLPVPNNLGSPGAPNSVLLANAGPALYQVSHSPAVPPANQPVVVTARVHDPDGVQNVILHYRVDPSTAYATVSMNDSGVSGDVLANDGIFSATIPGRSAGTVVAFYLTATDSKGALTRFPALLTNNAPVPECVVMFGDTVFPGAFTTYHSWITTTNINRWADLSDLSNETCDFTFVNNTRVIYNVQGRFAGSPYHQEFDTPVGNLCHYKWEFPDDDQFLGATDFNKIHQPGNGPGDDASLQREQLAHTFLRALGVPWLNRRYVAVYVNGNRRGVLMEDAQTPSADIVKEHYPNDSGGFLFKMQPWFEFAPFPSGNSIGFNNNSWCVLQPFTTTGGFLKTARYRYMFEMRRTPDSANDYNDVFSLVGAANSPSAPNYVANLKNIANMENWMRVFAANHAAGNWDSFGAQNGQNLYGYIGTQGTKYSLFMWDFNIVIGNSGSWAPGQNLFNIDGGDPNLQAIYANPEFLRMYWRALQELVNGPLSPAVSAPFVNAKYQAFANSGLNVENPTSAILPWLGAAQSSIASQLAAVNASAFSVNPNVLVSNNVAYISGSAPVNVASVSVNGSPWPIVWTSLTGWTVAVPLQNGTNQLAVTGLDRSGNPISGDSASTQAVLTSPVPSPVGKVVINEIMYNPGVSNAQFVEFFNNSSNTEFDLSGWQAPQLSYTFPPGSAIAPNSFLVLAANGIGYDNSYGATNAFFDTFPGSLPLTGQTLLSLVKPSGNSNATVAQVRYSDQLPWPTNAAGAGSSLQLIDPLQDNWRPANWAATSPALPGAPQWIHAVATGTATTSLLYIYLQSAGDVYIDDIDLVAGSVAETGPNLLPDGGFESGFPGTFWTVSTNLSGSALSRSVKHSGNASLHVVASSAGSTKGSAIWQVISPSLQTNAAYTLSYWYLAGTNDATLTVRLSGSGIDSNVTPGPVASTSSTPDAANSVAATLPTFPTLWINEVEPNNLTGLTNSVGQRVPWIEIYNPGSNAVDLSPLFLSTNDAALTHWAFPEGATIDAGAFLVVFADGQTNLTSPSELHANFTLPPISGSVALSWVYDNVPQALDYVDYSNIPADDSYGSLPDGQSFLRQIFSRSTPGSPNGVISAPAPSFIPYLNAGDVYAQDFDSLPDPGATSVGAANPVTINGVTYSLSNPFDFAFPFVATGKSGGLGLSSLAGWYGLADPTASVGTRFGATDGDDTTGGDLSFGLPNDSNRALGLLATSTTGYTAFGAKFINATGETLNEITLHFTSEIWRQSNLAKTIQCYYLIDPSATNSFSTAGTAALPALNINFPTVAADTGGVAVDGTAPANQIPLGVTNQSIVDWPPGAALWIVWEMASPAGKSQGMGIDDLTFSAGVGSAVLSPVPITAETSGSNVVLGWVGLPGQEYQIQYTTNLTAPVWLPLGAPVPGSGAPMSFTNAPGALSAQFYRLEILPLQ